MSGSQINSERAKAIVEKLWANKSPIGLNVDERALLEELVCNYLESKKYYSIKVRANKKEYQRLIDMKIVKQSEFRSSCVLLTTMEQRELENVVENEGMSKGGHVIGYTNPTETITQDIYRAIQIIDAKDFIGEAYNLGSYKSNYMDLYFTVEVDASKKEFEDGSEYSRNVYLKLDFSNFRNAEASALASKTLKTKIHFYRDKNRYLLNTIKFRPLKNEIDYRKDWLEKSVREMIKGVDFVYKKYPQLLETGSHPNMGAGGTAGEPAEAEIRQMNPLIADYMGAKKMVASYYIPEHGELQSTRDDRAEHDSVETNESFRDSELKYHSSWNWLMPVVKKIILSGHGWKLHYIKSKKVWTSRISKNVDWESVPKDAQGFRGGVKLSRDKGELFEWTNECDIISVWYSVVQFVKWHRHNQPEESSLLKDYYVIWQQHDEDGNPSRKRKESFEATSPKDAWNQAFAEGDHSSDYLISIDDKTPEELGFGKRGQTDWKGQKATGGEVGDKVSGINWLITGTTI